MAFDVYEETIHTLQDFFDIVSDNPEFTHYTVRIMNYVEPRGLCWVHFLIGDDCVKDIEPLVIRRGEATILTHGKFIDPSDAEKKFKIVSTVGAP